NGFARHIGEKHVRLLARHGQACALHAHAIAKCDACEIEVRGIESQLEIAVFVGNRNESAGCHDDSGKHTQASFGFKMRRKSAPMRRTSTNSKPRVIASRPPSCGVCASAPRKSA